MPEYIALNQIVRHFIRRNQTVKVYFVSKTAIPGGSYVILAMVLTSVGIPAESMALIIGIDRPLDMLRTSVNVTGDVSVALMIDRNK